METLLQALDRCGMDVLHFIGRYGATASVLGMVALAALGITYLIVQQRMPSLVGQLGVVLGVENNMAAVGGSAIALGLFIGGITGMGATVMTWACKMQEDLAYTSADHYWADNFAYPGNGTATTVTPTNFGGAKYLSATPHCFTNLTGVYTFTGSANGGTRTVTVTETGTHDPLTLKGIGGDGSTDIHVEYDSSQGGLVATT